MKSKKRGRRALTPEQKRAAAEHHAALKAIAKRATIGMAEAARHLVAMKQDKLYTEFGASSLAQYAARVLGYSSGHTRDLVALEERLAKFPKIAAEFRAGNLEWTKAREATRGAEATGNEDRWLELAKRLTNAELERARAEATGEPVKCRFTVEYTEAELAEVEAEVDKLRREHGEALTMSQALLELVRRARVGGAASTAERAGTPTHLCALSVCSECGKVEMRSSRGTIELTPEALGVAACSSLQTDLTEEHTKLERKIPRAVLRYVRARDHDGCIFPGCPNKGFLEAHHEGGWREVGHDRTKVYLLCTSHHQDRHCGRILAALEGSVLQFALSSGECVGDPIELDVAKRKQHAKARAKDTERSHERKSAAAAAREPRATARRSLLDAALDRAVETTENELLALVSRERLARRLIAKARRRSG